jgi:phosphoadenosine phosphosulfate reductase
MIKRKVKIALRQLEELEPKEGFYLAFSGGKDSLVIKLLADMAKVKYDAHYNMTTIDPPELTRYIKKNHPDVIFEKPKRGFFTWLLTKGYPTRQFRWCCSLLKERGGEGRFVITGVRAAESAKRAKRKKIEFCYKNTGKRYLNLIIDWTDEEVWEFIRKNKAPYCSLYDEGFKRIGCVMCPYNTQRKMHLKRFPKMVKAFRAAFRQRYDYCVKKNLTSATRFKSGEDMFNFWINEPKNKKEEPDQTVMYE